MCFEISEIATSAKVPPSSSSVKTLNLLLLVNPYASAVSPRAHKRIRRLLSEQHFLAEELTTERGNATEIAKNAAKEGAGAVCVLGGDGTLNEVANGLRSTDTILAPLPGGSTNVLARSLGIPMNPVDAAERTLSALRDGEYSQVGLGSVNERRFLFHAGVGFDAKVVELVERRSDLKRWLRHPLFIWEAGASWLWHFDKKNTRFAASFGYRDYISSINDIKTTKKLVRGFGKGRGLLFGSNKWTGRKKFASGQMAVCLNTSPYTYLGNRALDIAPEASLDAKLVLAFVHSLTGAGLIRLAIKALRGGDRIKKDRRVDYRSDLKSFSITSHIPVPYQVDGDFVEYATHLDFHYDPEALWLVRPQ